MTQRSFPISSEALVSLGIATVVAVGMFYTLKTSLEYDEEKISRIEERLDAVEAREREDRDILVRLDHYVMSLDQKVDKVLLVLSDG